MRARLCGTAALGALALVALVLSSCGGSSNTPAKEEGGASAPQVSKQPAARKQAEAKADGGSRPSGAANAERPPLTRASAAAAERRARRRERAARRKLERKAGKAAPFLVSQGDNSIPTYGSDASAGASAAAEGALARYLAARAAGEWAAACAQMSVQVQKQLALLAGAPSGGAKGCPAAYAKLSQRVPAAARANPLTGSLTALRVRSPHAFALFVGPHEQQYMMPLEEEGGAWKVAQIEPLPWPIGSRPSSP